MPKTWNPGRALVLGAALLGCAGATSDPKVPIADGGAPLAAPPPAAAPTTPPAALPEKPPAPADPAPKGENGFVIAVAVKNMGLSRVRLFLRATHLSADGLRTIAADLSASRPEPKTLREIFTKAERGALPKTLGELVPEFLDAVPADDFDGKPLRYSADKKVVHSIGSDLKDDGGSFRNVVDLEPAFPIDF